MPKGLQPSISLGALISTGSILTTRIFGVLVSFFVVKLLTPEELGLFLGVQAMVFLGVGFCDLGFSHSYRLLASRAPARRKELLGATIIIQTVALLVYFGLLSLYMYRQGYLAPATVLIAVGALLAQWPTVLNIDLLITRKFRSASIMDVLSIGGLALGAALAFLGPDRFAGLALGYVAGMLIRAAFAVYLVGPSNLRPDFGSVKTQLRASVPFFSSLVLSRIGQYFGVSYVLAMDGAHAAGILGFPVKVYQVMLAFASSTTGVTLPHFHRLAHEESSQELGGAVRKLIGPLWIVGGGLAGVCILIPDVIVTTIGSSAYSDSAHLLRILGFSFLLKALAIPAGNLLESRDRQWLRVAVQAVSASIIVFAVLFLFPRMGPVSIVYAMLAADAFSFVLLWGLNAVGMASDLPWHVHIKGAISLLVAMGLALTLSRAPGFLTALIFLLMFVALATGVGVWNPVQLVRRALGRPKNVG